MDSLCLQGENTTINYCTWLLSEFTCSPRTDPPDEIIERITPPPPATQPTDTASLDQLSTPSFLCIAVARIKSDGAFKIRMLFGFLCSLAITVFARLYDESFSYLTVMLIMEVTLLLCITMMSKSDPKASMKGDWILQLKGLLAFLNPNLPDLFETSYLCLRVLAIVLNDLCVMIFGVVVFMSVSYLLVI